jgi:phosphatidylglycerol:prolipoprotein diacylglycerol transferase
VYPIITRFEVFGIPITIYAFGTFLVLAFLAAALYVRRRAVRSLGLDGERVFNVAFAVFFLGLGGARLLYAFIHYETFASKPLSFLEIWNGGLVFYGGLLAALAWLAWYLPRHPEQKGFALLDVFAVGAALAVFVGRWASFLSGENYGKPAGDLPWGVTFPLDANSQAPQGVALHPTQLYHGLHGLLLFALLALYLRRRPHPGRVAGLFLALYALGHAVIEIWRADDSARGMVIDGLLSSTQLLSVPIFFLGVALFLLRRPSAAT